MQSRHFKSISAYWDNLDIALVGIGSPAIRDGANWHAFTAVKRVMTCMLARSPETFARAFTISTVQP
jgi:DNA-binding transcriptional regulator LsrR (DeoR family)